MEFEPFEAEVKRCSQNVEEEVSLAKAQADCQDQQLQLREREAASEGRKFWQSFITKSGKENEEFRKWRIQRDERNASKHQQKVHKQCIHKSAVGKRTQRLLDSLTSYNHLAAFKQARKRRHGNTAQWLTQSPEFNQWTNEPGSSVFWCSGKREHKPRLARVKLMIISSRIWENDTHVSFSTTGEYQAMTDRQAAEQTSSKICFLTEVAMMCVSDSSSVDLMKLYP